MFKKKNKAFTLIELLVVIAIIGILSTITVVVLQNARAKSRDAKRIADIKQMQTALELYFNDNGSYPTSVTSTIASGSNVYMTLTPVAPTPIDGDCTTTTNAYTYSSDGSTYSISFCLGNHNSGLNAGSKVATREGISNPPSIPVWGCGDLLVDDRDNQTYPTVQIGNQCWMSKGINYNNGCSSNLLGYSDVGACGCYNGITDNCTTYGRLYQWSAAMNGSVVEGAQGVCPSGWHVPNSSDWSSLITYLSNNSQYWCGGNSTYIAKALGSNSGWYDDTTSCGAGNVQSNNNASGFNAFPKGYYNGSTGYREETYSVYFWTSSLYSSTKSYMNYLYCNQTGVIYATTNKGNALYVRCLKN
jgi:uncharacterized protein (TIGR02145 family)/prepilin-type N-terminal cleavage/methylation domain-containing protein